jgi:hypothetical protein
LIQEGEVIAGLNGLIGSGPRWWRAKQGAVGGLADADVQAENVWAVEI